MNLTNTNSLDFKEVERNPLVVIDLATLQLVLSKTFKSLFEDLNQTSIINPQPPNDDQNDLMDMTEVLKFLKVSKVTIHNWKKKGIIKSHRIGRKLYFKKSELDSAIRLQKYSLK
jgi:excisionase family DNA binding protein